MKKRVVSILLVFAMLITFVPFAGMAAAPKYNAVVSIDGVKVGFTNKPYVQGDTLFVPVEELAGYLKFTTKGNDYGTGITIKNGDVEALLSNGNVFVSSTFGVATLSEAPVFEKGVFYAPIDVFSDVFSFPVSVDADNRTANITSGYYRFEISEENAAVVSVDEPDRDILNTSVAGSDGLVYNEKSEPPQEISAYYKFDMSQIAGKKIKSAVLNYSAARGNQYYPSLKVVKADNWDKKTISYNNQPQTYPLNSASGDRIPGSVKVGAFNDYSVDITKVVEPTEENPIASIKLYGVTYHGTTANVIRTVQVNLKGVNTPDKAYIEVICDEQLSFPAYTEEVLSVTEENAFDQVSALTKLGVLTTEDEFPSDIAEYVSRGEFVHYAVRLLNDKFDYTPEGGDHFIDVTPDNPYYAAINTAVANKAVALADDGEFRPDDYITPTEAIIIVDRILGYEDYARHNQSYPTGYILVAQQAGLLGKVNTAGDEFSYKDMFQLLFNAMSAPKMTIVSYSSTGEAIYDFDENTTIMNEEFDAYEVEGVLSANNYTDIDYNKSTDETTVKIDDVAYYSENEDFNELIGYSVTAYYKENDAGRNEIVYVGLDKKNSSTIIDYNDINSVTSNADGFLVKYETETDEDEVQIYTSKPIIYNGKAIAPNRLTQSMINGDIGTLTLVSNGGADYDVLFIESYKTLIANGVDAENELIFDRYNSALKLSTAGKDYFALKKASKNLEISEIVTGDVISYAESLDGKYVKAYVSNSIMNGEIQSVFKENGEIAKVTIKGVEFEVKNRYTEWTQDLAPGLSGTFFFDNFGNIVNFETNEISDKFGVVVGVDVSTRISKEVSIAIHTGDTEEYKTYKVAKNVRVTEITGETKDPVTGEPLYDGSPVPAADIRDFFYVNDQLNVARQGITFSLNSEKEISEISTLYCTDYTSYNTDGLLHKNRKFQDFFYVSSETLSVKEPDGNDNTVLEDYEIIMGNFTNDEKYKEVKVYTIDPMKAAVNIIMLPLATESGTAPNSSLSVVTDFVSAVDEEGNLIKKITVNEAGTSKTFIIPNEYINAPLFDTIEIGDIVRYGSNYKSEISCTGTLDSQIALKKIYDYSSKNFNTVNFNAGINRETRIYGGYVYDKDGDYVRFVDAVKYEGETEKDISTYDPVSQFDLFNWYSFPEGSKLYKYDVKNNARKVEVTDATINNMVTYRDLGYAASGVLIQSRYESLTTAYVLELTKTENTGKLVASFTGGDGALGNVTYKLDEGESVTVVDGTGFTKAGHKLVGWTDNFGNSYNFGDAVTVSSDMIFTAIWQPAHYVKFVGGDGTTGSMADITIQTAGAPITIPSCGFTKTGYALDYWTDGTNNYGEGTTITPDDTADVVLTAVWTNTNISTIALSSGLSTEIKYVKNGNSYVLPQVNDTAKATFVGWTRDGGATVETAGTQFAVSGDEIFEGVWQMKFSFTDWAKVSTANEVYVNHNPVPTKRGISDKFYFEFPAGGITNAEGIVEAKVVYNAYRKYTNTTIETYGSTNLSAELLTLAEGSVAQSSVLPVDGSLICTTSVGKTSVDASSDTDALVDTASFTTYFKNEIASGKTKVTFMFKDTYQSTMNGDCIRIYPDASYVMVKILGSALPDHNGDVMYTFTGDGNTGGTAPSGGTVGIGTSITLPANTFEKTGHNFAGWTDGHNTYNPGQSVVLNTNKVFKPIWEVIILYTDVTYTANGGLGADIVISEVQNSVITLPSCTFTNADKVFAGWSDGNNVYQAGESYNLGTTPVIFTATWEALEVVTFVVDGVTTTQAYSAGTQITLENKTKTASVGTYTFLGWNDGVTTHPAGSAYIVTGDVTLTAKWSYTGGSGTLNWEKSLYFATSTNGAATGTVTLNPTGHLYLYRNFPTAAYYAKVDISDMENVTSALLNVKVTKVNLASIMTVYEIDETAYENAFSGVSNGDTMNTSALPGGTTITSQTYSSTSSNNAGFYASPSLDITNWLKSKVEAGEKYVYIMIKNTHTGTANKDGIRVRWFHTDANISVTTATN